MPDRKISASSNIASPTATLKIPGVQGTSDGYVTPSQVVKAGLGFDLAGVGTPTKILRVKADGSGLEPLDITAGQLVGNLGSGPVGIPLGANLTFTGGALVAAGASGGGAGKIDAVADRTALAGVNPAVSPVVFLKEDGREGFFEWSPSNLSAFVAADTRQGCYVAPTSTPNGSAGAWVRVMTDKRFNFLWFGAKPDADINGAGTDNSPIMTAALALLQLFSLNPLYTWDGPELFCPGWYRFNSSIELKQSIRLTGMNNCAGNFGTIFWFTGNLNGIIVQRANTAGESGVVTATTGADAAIIDGIAVWSAGTGSTQGSGFVLRARATLRNCYARNFGLDGFYVIADAVSGISGNANLFHFEYCDAMANGRHGFHTLGADSNAGTIIGCNSHFNAGYGFFDNCFLGNYFYGCHAEYNGRVNYVNAIKTGFVNYGGSSYFLKVGATTGHSVTPGTDPNVWVLYANSPVGGAPDYAAGGTYQAGGPYGGTNTNNRGSFTDCYAEGGQAPSQFTSRHTVHMGFHAETNVVGGLRLWNEGQGYLSLTLGVATNAGSLFGDGRCIIKGESYWNGPSTDFAMIYRDPGLGLSMYGKGTAKDFNLGNSLGHGVLDLPTGTRQLNFLKPPTFQEGLEYAPFWGNTAYPGAVTDRGYIYRNGNTGLTMFGAGTTYDWLLASRNGAEVATIPSGSSTLRIHGTLSVSRPDGGKLTLPGLVNAADDAAASAGGVAVGEVYRNGSVLMVRVA